MAKEKGYAYWCSICTTFLPSKGLMITSVESKIQDKKEQIVDTSDTEDRAGIILVNNRGELLLVRGPTGKLSLPKGKRKVCETEYQAACRECLEESGINVKGMTILRKETIQDVVYFYVCYTGPLDATLASVNSSEIHQVKWYKILRENIKDIPKDFIIAETLHEDLLEEYMKKRCNCSLDTLLRRRKFYQDILEKK